MLNPPSCKKSCALTGPTAYSVGIVYNDSTKVKPLSKSRQRIFGPDIDPAAENDAYRLQVAKENVESNYKRDWIVQLEKKITASEARRQFDDLLSNYQEHLEERKAKLFKILEEEEDALIKEMEATSKQKAVNYEEILEKINCFKQDREARQREIVKAKMDMKFMANCEELRPKLSAKLTEAVLLDRREQVREQDSLRKIKQLEDEYYSCLWHADYLSKLHKEEQKALERHARNMDTLVTLNKQIRAKQKHKEELLELQRKEAKLAAEQREQMELERKEELEKKRKKKQELRQIIEENIAMSGAKKNEVETTERDFDKFYKNFLGLGGKKTGKMNKNERLKEAQKDLEQAISEKAEKAAKEAESDRLIQQDNDRMWEKYKTEKEKEKEYRRNLLEETLAIRKLQVQDKIAANQQQQEAIKKEVQSLQEMMEFNKQLVSSEEERHRESVKRYKQVILNQIEAHKQEQAANEEEIKREYDILRMQQDEYDKKLEETVQNVLVGKLHPMRYQTAINPESEGDQGETDTMIHMKMRINQLEDTVKNKKNEISEKTPKNIQKMEQFNNILSYYNPED